jgi:hypothetical protein
MAKGVATRRVALAGDGSVDFTLIQTLVTAIDVGWKRTGCVPDVYPRGRAFRSGQAEISNRSIGWPVTSAMSS